MAERLLSPVQEQAVPVQDAGFGEHFVGFEQVPVVVPLEATETLAAVERAPLEEPEEKALPHLRGPFLDGIAAFRDWLYQHCQAVEVFLIDRDGTPIFDESGQGKLHVLARGLAASSHPQGAIPGNVRVKVGASATLELIPVDTECGRLVLGAVVPDPLDAASVRMIIETLGAVGRPRP